MNVIRWLQAYATVYVHRLSKLDSKTILVIVALIVVAILASVLGPLATAVLGLIVIFVLPAINSDVRSEVEDEFRRRKF